jgi:imidazolonepropionase-like amidohydrolase
MHVAVHAHGTQGIRRAVDAGIDFIAHASFVGLDGRDDFDPYLADEIAARGIYTDSCPVPVYPPIPGLEGNGPSSSRLADLYEHGVRIVPGHDIGAVYPASAYTYGLLQLEAAGLPAAEVLIAATSRAAAAVGLAGVTGVLSPGYEADLLVVAGDPLADLGALNNLTEVIIGGRTFAREYVEPFDPTTRLGENANAPGTPNHKRQTWLDRLERAANHPQLRA